MTSEPSQWDDFSVTGQYSGVRVPRGKPLRPNDPQRLGSYKILGRLGEGGQGVVYLARLAGVADRRSEYRAIKLLHVQLSGQDSARARFIREAHAAMRVTRFCTAQILDADVEGDRPYIVSEYVSGPSLQALVRKEGPKTGESLHRLAMDTASALAAIHDAGIVHRDFKPHNVLLGPEGPRVIDFGLARTLADDASLTSGAVGTPAYMAPEQLGGTTVGPAADIFAWGATMTYAATGRPPFGTDSIPAVVNRVLHADPELGELTGPLRSLVAAALAKDAAERPAAQQIVQHLLMTPDKPYEPMLSSHILFTGGPVDGPPHTRAPRAPSHRPGAAPRPRQQAPGMRPPGTRPSGTRAPETRPPGARAPGTRAPDTRGPGAPADGGRSSDVPVSGHQGAARPAPRRDETARSGTADPAGQGQPAGPAGGPQPPRQLTAITAGSWGDRALPGRHRARPRLRSWLVAVLWGVGAVIVTLAGALIVRAMIGP
jgi:serine/threonine protein kinase